MRVIFVAAFLLLFPSALSAGETTRVVRYAPFSMNGLRTDLKVTSRVHGSCWIQSLASTRPDAWRCMSGNTIHDPCFNNLAASEVACPDDPFSSDVLIIVVNKPFQLARASNDHRAWALRLANGAVCRFVTGATGVIAGMRLNYACNSDGWVLGEVNRASKPWRAFYTTNINKSNYVQISVTEAIL